MNAPRRDRKRGWRRVLRAVLPVVLFVVVWLVHWFNDPRLSELEREARRRTGWAGIGAVNYGAIKGGDCPTDVTAAQEAAARAAQSYRERRPFMVRVLYCGMDTVDERVLIGTRNGEVLELSQMTDGLGKQLGAVKCLTWPRSANSPSKQGNDATDHDGPPWLRSDDSESKLRHYFDWATGDK